MHTTQVLAEHICQLRPESLPEEAHTSAIRCVLDLITAAAAGHSVPSVDAVRMAARAQFGTGAAEVWFTADRMTLDVTVQRLPGDRAGYRAGIRIR